MGEITTVGKLLLKSNVPADLRSFIDQNVLDAKGISNFFETLSKHAPDVYKKTVTNLTRLGFEISTRQGSSVGLSDLLSPVNKDQRFDEIDKHINEIHNGLGSKVEKENKIIDLYEKFTDKLNKDILEEGLKNNKTLAKVILSGSRGSPTQYRQTVAAPVLVNDASGKPMIDFPVKHSFAEGLSLPEYLAHSYGTRQGTVSTKLSVADAGYFSKQLTRATMTMQVEEHDCGTDNGLEVLISDVDSIGTYLAHPTGDYKKNNEVTPQMLNSLKGKTSTIVIRSPITCQSSRKFHSGAVCQLCIGKRERHGLPHLGDYVGITASTTLGERLSQGTLNKKHTSASAQKVQAASGFKLIDQLANIPKSFNNKSALAPQDGIITEIKNAPQGGHYVYVGNIECYVPTSAEVKVKRGQHVEAGDQLSDGIINPSEVVKLKGIGEGRKYFTEVMRKTFDDSGMKINRRNFEIISKAAIDHVRILDNEGMSEYLPGQVVSYQSIEKNYKVRPDSKTVRIDQAYNKYLEQPILHYTIGTRITSSIIHNLKNNKIESIVVNDKPPMFEPEMQRLLDIPGHEPDWMHQIYSTYLQKRFNDRVNTGAQSSLSGPSPVAGLAFGVGFGDKRMEKKSFDIEYATENPVLKLGVVGGECGCLMAVLEPSDAKSLIAWAQENIDEDSLTHHGYEHSPHVTIMYGFDNDFDYTELQSILEKYPTITFTLGKIGRFENKEKGFDVIKIDVESNELQEIHKALKEKFKDKIDDDYPKYNPHLTLAYIKPGTCKNVDDHCAFESCTYIIKSLIYSFSESKYKVDVPLGVQPKEKKAFNHDIWSEHDISKEFGNSMNSDEIFILSQLRHKSAEELQLIKEFLSRPKPE